MNKPSKLKICLWGVALVVWGFAVVGYTFRAYTGHSILDKSRVDVYAPKPLSPDWLQ